MLTALWLVLFASLVLWLAYQRASLAKATIALGVLLVYYTLFGEGAPWWKATLWALYLPHVLLNFRPLRRALVSKRFLLVFRRMLPPMSTTEREALEAGTVWWDGELFTGGPDWQKLLAFRPRTEEVADGHAEPVRDQVRGAQDDDHPLVEARPRDPRHDGERRDGAVDGAVDEVVQVARGRSPPQSPAHGARRVVLRQRGRPSVQLPVALHHRHART